MSGFIGQEPSPPVPQIGDHREGEIDAYFYDLAGILGPDADPIASITSVTIVRVTGSPVSGDLAPTPVGYMAPWSTTSPPESPFFGRYPTLSTCVNWWASAGSDIAASGTVQYRGTVSIMTSSGRVIERDWYQNVVAVAG